MRVEHVFSALPVANWGNILKNTLSPTHRNSPGKPDNNQTWQDFINHDRLKLPLTRLHETCKTYLARRTTQQPS